MPLLKILAHYSIIADTSIIVKRNKKFWYKNKKPKEWKYKFRNIIDNLVIWKKNIILSDSKDIDSNEKFQEKFKNLQGR